MAKAEVEFKVIKVLALNLESDGHTCLDVEVEVDGKREIWHIRSPEPMQITSKEEGEK